MAALPARSSRGENMGRISGRAITRTRCLWKADQIVTSIEVYIRNGGFRDLTKGDFSHIETGFQKLAKLRNTKLSKAEYETFRRRIFAAVRAGAAPLKPSSRPDH